MYRGRGKNVDSPMCHCSLGQTLLLMVVMELWIAGSCFWSTIPVITCRRNLQIYTWNRHRADSDKSMAESSTVMLYDLMVADLSMHLKNFLRRHDLWAANLGICVIWHMHIRQTVFDLCCLIRQFCNTIHRVPEKSWKSLNFEKKFQALESPWIWMFQQYLNIVHTMHNKTWQKRVVKRFFSGLTLALYFSFTPRPPPGLRPWTPLGVFRPPDLLTLVLENCNFRSLKSPWI